MRILVHMKLKSTNRKAFCKKKSLWSEHCNIGSLIPCKLWHPIIWHFFWWVISSPPSQDISRHLNDFEFDMNAEWLEACKWASQPTSQESLLSQSQTPWCHLLARRKYLLTWNKTFHGKMIHQRTIRCVDWREAMSNFNCWVAAQYFVKQRLAILIWLRSWWSHLKYTRNQWSKKQEPLWAWKVQYKSETVYGTKIIESQKSHLWFHKLMIVKN